MKNFIYYLKRGYSRPVSIPIWKMFFVYLIWMLCFVSYVMAMLNLISVIFGILLQSLGVLVMYIWDTGNWRNTEKGKKFIEKYENSKMKSN